MIAEQKIGLIVIDQQKGIDHPKLGERNNPNAESAILTLLATWREKNWPIYHIKHRSLDPNSVFWPKQEGFDFKPGFEPLPGEKLIEKNVPCAFTRNILEAELRSAHIEHIVIAGVATNNSVEATARSGGNLGLQVTVIESACFAFAKQDYFGTERTAQEVHAMSLANLQGEYAMVVASITDFFNSKRKG